jgi:hypothetical protein
VFESTGNEARNDLDHLGNLHLNIVADAYLPEIQDALEPYIYEVVGELSAIPR